MFKGLGGKVKYCNHKACYNGYRQYIHGSGYHNVCKLKVCNYPFCTVPCKCYNRKGGAGYCRLHTDEKVTTNSTVTDEQCKELWNELPVDPKDNSRRIVVDKSGKKRAIVWEHRGNRKLDTGWEVTHIHPYDEGGCTELHNLRIVHSSEGRSA